MVNLTKRKLRLAIHNYLNCWQILEGTQLSSSIENSPFVYIGFEKLIYSPQIMSPSRVPYKGRVV